MATNYKKIEIEIRELVQECRNGRASLYEIATRLVRLFNESDSYATVINMKPDSVAEHLNEYLRDFAVDLETVITLLNVFPAREQWNRPVLDMLHEARAKVQQRASENPLPTRRTAKVAELDAAMATIQSKTSELKRTTSELDRLRAENTRLQAANDRLSEKVKTLEGQVRELRRITKETAIAY